MTPLAVDPCRIDLGGLDRRIAVEIARLRLRYQLSLDEFRGLYVSDEQVEALLGAVGSGEQPADDPEEEATDLAPHGDERWRHVASVFGLSALDLELLALALAPEIDLRYETLFAYLNDDVTRKWPTASLAARLLRNSSGAPRTVAVLSALSPIGPLVRSRLLEPIEPPSGRPSLLNTGFSLAAPVSRFLQGFAAVALAPDTSVDSVHFGPELRQRVRRLATLLAPGGDMPVVVLAGPAGSGRMAGAQALAGALNLPVRVVDVRALRREGANLSKELATVALEAALQPALICLCGVRALADADGRLPAEWHGALAAFGAPTAPLAILAADPAPWRDLLGGRRALIVRTELEDDERQRARVWSRHLEENGIGLSDPECRALADRFQFSATQIAQAAATARDWKTLIEPPHPADFALVRDAAREQASAPLGALARIDRGRFGWDDLILPATVLGRLQELASAIRLRHVVYGEWGFGARFSGGRGVKAMFAGPSGTGKTMAAGVIAAEVGLDLIKVDLSGLVSKYIGDTEKNLDRVFAGARAGSALLFFDEADAIFGKRSEVKDAHDRYANIEVAYLLQKIEDHDGVVVLATNLRRNIDEAFSRRLHYVVDFPAPDAALRERLWRGMFPADAPVADDVDFPFLARQFELAGGDIRNVVLDAAFLAADGLGVIGMKHLVRALARQLAKQGRTPSRTDFQRYFELVA